MENSEKKASSVQRKMKGGEELFFYFNNAATFSSHFSPKRNNCSSFEFKNVTEMIVENTEKSHSIGQDNSPCKLPGVHHVYQILHLAGTRRR